jgi:hypothetical protein
VVWLKPCGTWAATYLTTIQLLRYKGRSVLVIEL